MNKNEQIQKLNLDWETNPRWEGVERPYDAKDVVNLRGSLHIEYSIAKSGAMKLWQMLQKNEPVTALGAVTGNQAIQEVQAGLQAIYWFTHWNQYNTNINTQYDHNPIQYKSIYPPIYAQYTPKII